MKLKDVEIPEVPDWVKEHIFSQHALGAIPVEQTGRDMTIILGVANDHKPYWNIYSSD